MARAKLLSLLLRIPSANRQPVNVWVSSIIPKKRMPLLAMQYSSLWIPMLRNPRTSIRAFTTSIWGMGLCELVASGVGTNANSSRVNLPPNADNLASIIILRIRLKSFARLIGSGWDRRIAGSLQDGQGFKLGSKYTKCIILVFTERLGLFHGWPAPYNWIVSNARNAGFGASQKRFRLCAGQPLHKVRSQQRQPVSPLFAGVLWRTP